MKIVNKTVVFVAALAAAGSLPAQNPYGYQGGPGMMNGGYGHPGMMYQGRGPGSGYGMMNDGYNGPNRVGPRYGAPDNRGWGRGMGHGPGMMGGPGMMHGPGMMGPGGAYTAERLADLKAELGIGPEQEGAWNGYAEAVQSHAAQAEAMHQSMGSRGYDPSARYGQHQAMWQSRQNVYAALQDLRAALTPQQQQRAQSLIGPGW
ncbi:MAG: Spy/CpxP family protein refolding chaperone [Sedimenticola sp.]|nr:Spy/CpxP family protein refolding chaperone [Sedimenticola sp.]